MNHNELLVAFFENILSVELKNISKVDDSNLFSGSMAILF